MNARVHKCAIVILDGLGDLPSPELGGKTPLEAADTPVMNRLAGSGLYGLVDPVGPGVIPSTHSGCGVLLGVPPEELAGLQRGPVEAAGAGRALRPGEIALRTNFATLEETDGELWIRDRRAGRIDTETEALAFDLRRVDLGDGVFAELRPTDQHRCVLVLSGPGLSPAVSDTDPGDGGLPGVLARSRALDGAAARTAGKLNLFLEKAHAVLVDHPVNAKRVEEGKLPATGLITRGAGQGFSLDNRVKALGVRAAVVAGCNTVIGLARSIGFQTRTDKRFTAAANTDLQAKMEAVEDLLKQHDLVYVHVKAPDLFAHDHQPGGKRRFLERIDEALGRLEQAGVMIVIAADHSTDSNSGAHTADPVPALFYQPLFAKTSGSGPVNFGETLCANGSMPRQRSHELLTRVLEAMTE